MTKKRIRDVNVHFYLTKEESEIVKSKMQSAGYSNISAFIRDTIINGYVINVDTSGFNECVKELNAIGKNINQITKLCNLERSVFLDDMEKIQSEMNKIFLKMNSLFRNLEIR